MKTKSIKSYLTTSVHWGKSQADISKLLLKYGVSDTRFTFLNSTNELICEFNYPTKVEDKDVLAGVKWILPVKGNKDLEKAKNQIHRVLFYSLKAKFECIEFGAEEFMEVFMSKLIVKDDLGNLTTLGRVILDQYKGQLITGQQGGIKMIEGPK